MKYSPNHFDKRVALNQLRNTSEMKELAPKMIKDKHQIIRNAGLDFLDANMVDEVKKMIISDKHSSTRAKALKTYQRMADGASVGVAEKVLSMEKAYGPIKAAIDILKIYNKPKAIEYADKLRNEKATSLIGYLTDIYAESGDPKYLDYIENNLTKVDVYQVFNVFGNYNELLLQQGTDVMMMKVDKLKEMAINDGNMYRRYLSTNTINSIKGKLIEEQNEVTDVSKKMEISKNVELLTSTIAEIISKEKDDSLIARYESF